MSRKVLVSGAGGFIGHHLVSYPKEKGYQARGSIGRSWTTAPTASTGACAPTSPAH